MDVIISCYAGGRPEGVVLPNELRVIDWPGQAKPKGHPTWGAPAAALRQNGQLLGPLLKKYRVEGVERIGVIGFSAGFGGVRELLRNAADAQEIDVAVVIDSIHLPMKGQWDASDWQGSIAAWEQTAQPFARFMARAAEGQALWVSTWGDIPRPAKGITTAAEGNASLYRWLEEYFSSGVASAPPPIIPNGFPVLRRSSRLRPEEPYPVPSDFMGRGRAVGMYYGLGEKKPTLQNLKRSHVVQAQVILPDIWREFIAPRWGGGIGCPPKSGPTESGSLSEGVCAEPSSARGGSALVWGVLGGLATVGGAMLASWLERSR